MSLFHAAPLTVAAQTKNETVSWLQKVLVNYRADYQHIGASMRTIERIRSLEVVGCELRVESDERTIIQGEIIDYTFKTNWKLESYTIQPLKSYPNTNPTAFLPAGYSSIVVTDVSLAERVKRAFDHLAVICGAQQDPF